MTGVIMWRGWQSTCGQRLFPIRLSFKIATMTIGTMLAINCLASRNLFGIRRICRVRRRVRAGNGERNHQSDASMNPCVK
ncbi:MAG: hypothetical protein ETSY1_44450 [Candidatus Entotheonella factor]|uniref:Uncharacterized protein n=1 Tax=Entotheonella factor TaxID=1429438 RepID=W4L4K6_ENTF1|nr:MAG: hypothetical protein ETSY1_44450 [Candidatus Entotheonella factor]